MTSIRIRQIEDATRVQILARDQSSATAIPAACCLLSAFRELGIPSTLVDIGCGAGHLVRLSAALGVNACGVDITLPRGRSMGYQGLILEGADLTKPWSPPWRGDMALCLEVAEHLPESAADVLCDTVLSSVRTRLLFSAATPGQGGAGHINEQPHEYWLDRLSRRGLVYDVGMTSLLRKIWHDVAPGAWWYGKNLMVFER